MPPSPTRRAARSRPAIRPSSTRCLRSRRSGAGGARRRDAGRAFHGLFLDADLATRVARVGARNRDASDADAAVARAQESYDLGELDWRRVDASGTPGGDARPRPQSALPSALHRSNKTRRAGRLDCPPCPSTRKIAVATAGFCTFLNLYSPQALLPALAREFGVGAAEISTIMTASALAIALTAPFTGAIADVLGRKRVITAAMLAVVVPMAGAARRRTCRR